MVELKINFAKTFSVSIIRVEFETEIVDRQTETLAEVKRFFYAFTVILNIGNGAKN